VTCTLESGGNTTTALMRLPVKKTNGRFLECPSRQASATPSTRTVRTTISVPMTTPNRFSMKLLAKPRSAARSQQSTVVGRRCVRNCGTELLCTRAMRHTLIHGTGRWAKAILTMPSFLPKLIRKTIAPARILRWQNVTRPLTRLMLE